MSDFPDSPETGREHLRRAVAALPPREPEAATWPRITAQMAAGQAIAQTVPTLPEHEPDADLWKAITSRLDEAAAPATAAVVVRPLWPVSTLQRMAGVAATVLLMVGAWWTRPTSPNEQLAATVPHETMTFSEEVVPTVSTTSLNVPADPLAQEGKVFIDAHCVSLPTVCQSSEFQELRTQLTEVEAQERRLRQDAQRFGKSPGLVRQQVQLTILRAEITRELVQLLIS